MKKIILLPIIALLCFSVNNTMAQGDHSNALTVNAGFSLVGNIFSLPDATGAGDIGSYSTPAFQIGYDHFMIDWFSLGAAVSFQQMGIKYESYVDTDGTIVDGELKIIRMNFAARALFHYVNRDRLDLFSGLRLGFTNWNISEDFTTNDGSYDYGDVFNFSGTNFSPQVILFGVRGYFTDNFGANMELCAGAPYYFSLGLNYKF